MSYDPSAQPRTIDTGKGTGQTKTFRLPAGVVIKPESIVAAVSYGGAADFPELIIKSPGGAVIARKPQRDTTTGGDTGDATWALRLDDAAQAAATSGAVEVGYYNINEVSHPNTGLQNFTMNLVSTSDPTIFDVTGARARIQAGAYNLFANLNFGQTQTFTGAGTAAVSFGMTFVDFPFYTHGLIGQIIPSTAGDGAEIWTMGYQGQIVCDTSCRLQLNLQSFGGVARDLGDVVLTIERVRPFDWSF
jgi:hypothetical protein